MKCTNPKIPAVCLSVSADEAQHILQFGLLIWQRAL